ncbi:MAG: hypothetical protein ABI723_01295 [Bacteroidia bacterium]
MEKILVDFHNSDKKGRVRLNTNGTRTDLEKNNIILIEGIELLLHDGDELVTKGIINYSKDENIWVAEIDWNDLKNKE